jgi:uncharacterized lipoprotein
MKKHRLHVMIASACLLTGCSHLPFTHKTDYSAAKPGAQLEVPPDLTHPAQSDRYVVPQAPAGGHQSAPPLQATPGQSDQAALEPFEPTHAKLSEENNDITLDLPIDRAWRRVGLALDKIGFSVDDQNRAKGTYFVSYADPEAKKADEGFLSNLEFWKEKKPAEPQKFQIQVGPSGNGSIVSVLDVDGFHVHTETSAKILQLIYEQLK